MCSHHMGGREIRRSQRDDDGTIRFGTTDRVQPQVLWQSALFRHLSDSQLERLAAAGRCRRYDIGEEISEANASSDTMLFVAEGEVGIYRQSLEGAELEVDTVGQGEFYQPLPPTEHATV